jgi:hypothetical protein
VMLRPEVVEEPTEALRPEVEEELPEYVANC